MHATASQDDCVIEAVFHGLAYNGLTDAEIFDALDQTFLYHLLSFRGTAHLTVTHPDNPDFLFACSVNRVSYRYTFTRLRAYCESFGSQKPSIRQLKATIRLSP